MARDTHILEGVGEVPQGGQGCVISLTNIT